jgi:putative flippase GtrA
LVRFSVIGALGFVVDAGALALLIAGGVDLYLARLISFPLAVTVTWYLNRVWSFRGSATARPAREYAGYVAVQTVGAAVNFAVYVLSLRLLFAEQPDRAVPALALGSAVGLILNYLGARWLVFVGRALPGPAGESPDPQRGPQAGPQSAGSARSPAGRADPA